MLPNCGSQHFLPLTLYPSTEKSKAESGNVILKGSQLSLPICVVSVYKKRLFSSILRATLYYCFRRGILSMKTDIFWRMLLQICSDRFKSNIACVSNVAELDRALDHNCTRQIPQCCIFIVNQ